MERMTLGPEPRVIHLGWEGGKARPGRMKHRGVMTLAILEKAPQLMVVGFTFCSPTDMFDKKLGKDKALDAMRHRPLRFRYIGNPFTTLKEVIRCLCLREFEALGHFCGYHLDHVLFTMKLVPRAMRGGLEIVDVLEKACRVPAWAQGWWHQGPGDIGGIGIRDVLEAARKAGMKVQFGIDRPVTGRTGLARPNSQEPPGLPLGVRLALDELLRDIRTGGFRRV